MDINQPPYGAGWTPAAISTCLTTGTCNPDAVAEQKAQPYFSSFPYLSYIAQQGNLDFSNYNGLQVTANMRPTHGLSFLAGYTFAHALDILSANVTGQQVSPIDARNVRLSYGTGNNDIRNRFTFSPTYLFPGDQTPGQMLPRLVGVKSQ